MSIQSRRISFLKRLVEKSLALFYSTLAVIYISLLWNALKLKNQNKEQFVSVSVLEHCDGFMNVAEALFDNASAVLFP